MIILIECNHINDLIIKVKKIMLNISLIKSKIILLYIKEIIWKYK